MRYKYLCSKERKKIFFSGKILTDEQPLTEYNIDEKKFIVVMVSKPKVGVSPSTSEEVKADGDSSKEQSTPR